MPEYICAIKPVGSFLFKWKVLSFFFSRRSCKCALFKHFVDRIKVCVSRLASAMMSLMMMTMMELTSQTQRRTSEECYFTFSLGSFYHVARFQRWCVHKTWHINSGSITCNRYIISVVVRYSAISATQLHVVVTHSYFIILHQVESKKCVWVQFPGDNFIACAHKRTAPMWDVCKMHWRALHSACIHTYLYFFECVKASNINYSNRYWKNTKYSFTFPIVRNWGILWDDDGEQHFSADHNRKMYFVSNMTRLRVCACVSCSLLASTVRHASLGMRKGLIVLGLLEWDIFSQCEGEESARAARTPEKLHQLVRFDVIFNMCVFAYAFRTNMTCDAWMKYENYFKGRQFAVNCVAIIFFVQIENIWYIKIVIY